MLYWNLVTVREVYYLFFYFAMNQILFFFTDLFVLCGVMLSVWLLLVVRFGHWVCRESWHAI